MECLPAMEEALTVYAAEKAGPSVNDEDVLEYEPWQIMLCSDQNPKKLRELGNSLVNKMLAVQGIVVTCTKPYVKASVLRVQCKTCKNIKTLVLNPGDTPGIPRKCKSGPGR
jgi:DNA replication licensing factor MCM5